MFSVDTEEEARALIATACPMDNNGTYYARELQREQTLENLKAFSDKLARVYKIIQQRKRKDHAQENQS